MSNGKKVFLIVLVVVLAGLNVFLAYKSYSIYQSLEESNKKLTEQRTNAKVLTFTKLLVEKVLKSKDEIDFETRLQLENAVRSLDDQAILAKWNGFVNSETDFEAQSEMKDLLELLVNKIQS